MYDDLEKIFYDEYLFFENINTDEFTKERKYTKYVSCIGSPKSYSTKLRVLNLLNIKNWTNLCLSSQMMPQSIGVGNIILPHTYISPSSVIGNHCLIMNNCTIHHGCNLGDGSNLASGVVLCGEVKLDGSCFIGANSTIKENITLCKNVLIGANSFVDRSIYIPGTYVGSPVRRIK